MNFIYFFFVQTVCRNMVFHYISQMSFSTPLAHPKHLPILPPFPFMPIPTSIFLLHPPTNPSPPCFSVLITIPILFPGSGVRTDPCGPSAPPSCPLFSAFLGFYPVPPPSPIRFVQAPSSSLLCLLPPTRFRQLKSKREVARARL